MAEQQAAHRQQLENSAFAAQIDDRKSEMIERRIGQYFALVIGVASLIASAVIIIKVPNSAGATVASIVGGSTVLGLVTAFVVGNHKAKKDSNEDSTTNSN